MTKISTIILSLIWFVPSAAFCQSNEDAPQKTVPIMEEGASGAVIIKNRRDSMREKMLAHERLYQAWFERELYAGPLRFAHKVKERDIKSTLTSCDSYFRSLAITKSDGDDRAKEHCKYYKLHAKSMIDNVRRNRVFSEGLK